MIFINIDKRTIKNPVDNYLNYHNLAVTFASSPVDNLWPCQSLQDGIFDGR
jgi:hypothetical protein